MVARQSERYRRKEQIGSGGMSVVYKGLDTELEREVAIKVLHPHLNEKEDSRRRFNREARAVAKLHHPNILEIFDFSGEDAPESFIVTELIDGKTLRAFAEEHAFDPPEIAAMAVHELAGALEHAHASGIIHRDLKPENVMIRKDGVLKLMDFGIAKVVDRDERMTMTGALVGSPAHMAPEIIEGQEAGRPADIFSLGTILYWLCCRNELPFLGNNTTQTLKLVLDGQYMDPRSKNPAVSDELAAVIARCLARDPAARYASAGQLKAALAQVLQVCKVERVGEQLVRFFQDPDGYRSQFRSGLVAHLLSEARASARGPGRSFARTIKWLNRILALDPQNRGAQELLASTRRIDRRNKRLKDAGRAVAGLAVLAGICVAGHQAFVALRTHRAEPVVKPGPGPADPKGSPVAAPDLPPAVVEPRQPDPPPAPVEPPRVAGPSRPPPRPDRKPVVVRPDPRRDPPRPVEVAAVDKPAEPVEVRKVQINLVPQLMTTTVRIDDMPELRKNVASWEVPLPVGEHVARVKCPACLDVPYPFEVQSAKDAPNKKTIPLALRLAATLVAEEHEPGMIVKVNDKAIAPSPDDPRKRVVPLPEGKNVAMVFIEVLRDGKPPRRWEQELIAGRENVLKVPER